MSCSPQTELTHLVGFKVYSDPKKNRIDSNLILKFINELTFIQNAIADNDMFLAGLHLGRFQGDLVVLMEQMEEQQKTGGIQK